ncbi:MAG: hypothetical protein ABSC21_11725 [Terriglobia bacterium]
MVRLPDFVCLDDWLLRGTPPQSPRALRINQPPCHLRPFTIQENPDAVHDSLWLINEGGVTCIGYRDHPCVLRSFGPFLCAIEWHVRLLALDHKYRNLQLGDHGTRIKIAGSVLKSLEACEP